MIAPPACNDGGAREQCLRRATLDRARDRSRKEAETAELLCDNGIQPLKRRNRLKGHTQERQHSAATWRDAGPSALGEKHNMTCARTEARRAETPSAPFTTARPRMALGASGLRSQNKSFKWPSMAKKAPCVHACPSITRG